MKKLIFIALVVFSSVAHAQALSAVLETGPAMDPTITNPAIANWKNLSNDYTITVFNDEKGSTIQFIKHSDYFSVPTPLPANYTSSFISSHFDNIYLTDISITDDYAIVCGWADIPGGGVGIIGYFDIQTSLLISQINLILYKVNSLLCINKVAAILNTPVILVEAIGSNDPVAWTNHDISNSIVQCDNILANPCAIRVANFQPNEWAYDILVSSNHFVSVGYESVSQSLCLRRFDRYIGITDPTINTQALIKTPVYSIPRATDVPDDELAITFLDYNGLIGFSTNLLIVNIASATNTSYQLLDIGEKTPPDDIAFIEDDKSIVILQQTSSGSYYNNSGFFFFDPQQTTNYISFADYFEKFIFHKITAIQYSPKQDFIVLSNDNRWALRRKTSTMPYSCPDRISTQIAVIPTLITVFNADPLTPTTDSPTSIPNLNPISIKIPTNTCFSL